MPGKSANHRPKVLELFAGVGGFRIGLEAAGWDTVWSNQWEPSTRTQHASSCYVANFGPSGHSNSDIAQAIDLHESGEDEIPDADLIVGGFPCQDYSVAKSLRSSLGLEGKKGVLWWQIHRLVAMKRPKTVFLENVDRLLKSPSSQRGRDFAVMLRTLGDLGYFIEWRIVNAADYGFNQRRIRLFIIAIRRDLAEQHSFSAGSYPTGSLLSTVFPHGTIENHSTFALEDDVVTISKSFNLGGKKSPFENAGAYLDGIVVTTKVSVFPNQLEKGSLGSVLVPDVDVPKSFWIDNAKLPEWKYLKGAKKIERVSSSGHSYHYSEGRMAFPDGLDKPSRTILTGEGGTSPSRFKHVVKTGKGYRRLLPIELERLNGFPDNWTKYDADGNEISDTKRAFFMGNALVVGLIEMVGIEIRKRLFET